jgi:hypothetical protein
MIQQWEYFVAYENGLLNEKWEGEKISLLNYLNKKGKEGWELVQGPSYNSQKCIFKRLLNSKH